ncbi:DinB family protein [Aeoliella mucimassa]|uniref:DinB superfamily protein n=1 Tax=Aeoliella mucimassa TaxID=2527972 RepID=A0A518AJG6_9BACT|nr:DinB family protein [Aeoliella mucimassa]QDU54872.1 DinB superfamily protein [Aeoliella mucimassa]
MNAKQAIAATLNTSSMVLGAYIGDLTDEELMERPGEGCNHIAWQLGHLISSECYLLNSLVEGAAPELPAGFAENHAKEKGTDDNPANFCTKQQYEELFENVHAATKAALEGLSEADLDEPLTGPMAERFPTKGHMWVLLSTHCMMHAGQIVPVRRRLGKPVTI